MLNLVIARLPFSSISAIAISSSAAIHKKSHFMAVGTIAIQKQYAISSSGISMNLLGEQLTERRSSPERCISAGLPAELFQRFITLTITDSLVSEVTLYTSECRSVARQNAASRIATQDRTGSLFTCVIFEGSSL